MGCCGRKKDPNQPNKKGTCNEENCLNVMCIIPWAVVLIDILLLLNLILKKCDGIPISFTPLDSWEMVLTIVILLTYIFLSMVLLFSLIFIILMKAGVTRKPWKLFANILLAIHLIVGVIFVCLVYFIRRRQDKCLPPSICQEEQCLKQCLVFILTMLVLGVIPYIVFILGYRKSLLKIGPRPRQNREMDTPRNPSSFNRYELPLTKSFNPRNSCLDSRNNRNTREYTSSRVNRVSSTYKSNTSRVNCDLRLDITANANQSSYSNRYSYRSSANRSEPSNRNRCRSASDCMEPEPRYNCPRWPTVFVNIISL